MKTQPQFISQNGLPVFVILPFEEYKSMMEFLEDKEDIESILSVRQDDNEFFPLELIESIAAGKNPVAAFRQHRKMTQEALAKKIGVSKQYISQMEKGERLGSVKVLKQLAEALQVDVDDLCYNNH